MHDSGRETPHWLEVGLERLRADIVAETSSLKGEIHGHRRYFAEQQVVTLWTNSPSALRDAKSKSSYLLSSRTRWRILPSRACKGPPKNT